MLQDKLQNVCQGKFGITDGGNELTGLTDLSCGITPTPTPSTQHPTPSTRLGFNVSLETQPNQTPDSQCQSLHRSHDCTLCVTYYDILNYLSITDERKQQRAFRDTSVPRETNQCYGKFLIELGSTLGGTCKLYSHLAFGTLLTCKLSYIGNTR